MKLTRRMPKTQLWALAACFGFALGAAVPRLRAQTGTAPASPLPAPVLAIPTQISPDLAAPEVPDNYVIGDNDLLSVFVFQMPALTRQVRVTNAGTITMPYLNTPVRAAGLTPAGLQHDVADLLTQAGLARSPMVQVTVRQVASKPIVIGGAVKTPGTIQASRPMSLLEVIAGAGGVTDQAGSRILVSRRESGGPPSIQEYSLDQIMQNPGSGNNPLLVGNEAVTVLPAQEVYVVGAFAKPGAFPLQAGQHLTVIRAVALAGGFAPHPDENRGEIIRTAAGANRQIIPVDLDRILKHQLPDVALQSDDILYVAVNERQKSLATALGDAAQVVTLGIAYTFPKW